MNLRIGGVPEHFNLPWELALERHAFAHTGIDLDWSFYAGGTGAMTNALKRGDLDMAILLTEGFISAVHQGLEAHIVKVYIDSPLLWGIHTAADTNIQSINDDRAYNYAISRFGSGSHLMAMIHAHQRNAAIDENHWKIVNSLHGAVDSLVAHESDLFYWEPFMTRPFVHSGQLRKVGDFRAPWSSFLIVATDAAIAEKGDAMRAVLHTMNDFCRSFIKEESTLSHLTRRFAMNEAEAAQWLRDTEWNYDFTADLELLVNARNALTRIGACDKSLRVEHLCADWIELRS